MLPSILTRVKESFSNYINNSEIKWSEIEDEFSDFGIGH